MVTMRPIECALLVGFTSTASKHNQIRESSNTLPPVPRRDETAREPSLFLPAPLETVPGRLDLLRRSILVSEIDVAGLGAAKIGFCSYCPGKGCFIARERPRHGYTTVATATHRPEL